MCVQCTHIKRDEREKEQVYENVSEGQTDERKRKTLSVFYSAFLTVFLYAFFKILIFDCILFVQIQNSILTNRSKL